MGGIFCVPCEGRYLRIEAMREGLVESWNRNSPENAAKVGDYIVSVNGVVGNGQDMWNRMINEKSLEIIISRQVPPQQTAERPAGRAGNLPRNGVARRRAPNYEFQNKR